MGDDAALSLRPWRAGDGPHLLAALASSDDLERQMPPLADLDSAEAWIASTAERSIFALCLEDRPIGQVARTNYDPRHGTAWFSYWIGADGRGRGWMSRAACCVADWALRDRGVRRIELGHRTNNPAPGRVAERAGFIAEGIERRKLVYGDEEFDVRTMSRLADDPWPDCDPIQLTWSSSELMGSVMQQKPLTPGAHQPKVAP